MQILMIFDVTGKLEFVCQPHMRKVAVNGLTGFLKKFSFGQVGHFGPKNCASSEL